MRWHESNPDATRSRRDRIVTKQLVVDGITIAASIVERAGSFAVDLEIANGGPDAIAVAPQRVDLDLIQPTSRPLRPILPDTIAARITRQAEGEAAHADVQGFSAMTVVHELVPVIETTPNPAAINDPTQPATITTMTSETVVKVVADEPTRSSFRAQATSIRQSAAADAREIVASALRSTQLGGGARIRGRIYYDRDRNVGVDEVLLRVPLDGPNGTVIAAIPFTAVERPLFLWKKLLTFE